MGRTGNVEGVVDERHSRTMSGGSNSSGSRPPELVSDEDPWEVRNPEAMRSLSMRLRSGGWEPLQLEV